MPYCGEVPYEGALDIMRAADVLLLNQEYPTDKNACTYVPAKTYEYLGMEKPILGLLPPGDARDFVVKSGLGTVAAPNDPEEIARKIVGLYQEHTNGGIHRTPDREFIEQFRSDRLARKVWDIFEEVTGRKPELALCHE